MDSRKKLLIDAFFNQFITFVGELRDMYPDDPDFGMFETTLKLMKMTNPSLVIKYVAESTSQFNEKILASDEGFFMDMDFSSYAGIDINIFTKLKTYIQGMSPESKVNVWKYIQNVTRLAQAIQPAK
jgi:hypothetical protein